MLTTSSSCVPLGLEEVVVSQVSWPAVPDLPRLTGPTIPPVGRVFLIHSPTTILKLGHLDNGESAMTALAHLILGSRVPSVLADVTIADPSSPAHGILVTRLHGTPLSELRSVLTPAQLATAKESLVDTLVRMRTPRFSLYGRPGPTAYVTPSVFGPVTHAVCATRAEWNESRVRALHSAAAPESLVEFDLERLPALEQVLREAGAGLPSVDAPVLTHGDLSDRNVLIDPETFAVTGLLDWEMANVAPAYMEYTAARLLGGHDPEWRKELLEVLRGVLLRECEREVAMKGPGTNAKEEVEKLFVETLATWNALVDVERPACGYSDDCFWTYDPPRPGIPLGNSSM